MNLPTLSLSKGQEGIEVSRGLSLAPSVAGVLISLVVLVFVVWPKLHEVLNLRSSNAELVKRAQSLETKANKLASLDKDTLEKQLAAAEQLLPSDKEVFPLLRQIEITASSSGVLLNKVDVVAGTINQGGRVAPAANTGSATLGLAPSVQVELSTTSSYSSFLQFLASLYSSSRVLSIENLTLSSVSAEGGVQVRSALSVSAFWKSLPSDLGEIETPIDDLTDEEVAKLKVIEAVAVSSTPQIPSVPLGRNDLFAPF